MTETYELRVGGHLDDHWSTRLGELRISHCGDGTSTLTGPIADQPQLHGILAVIRDIGVPLLSLRVLGPEPGPKPGSAGSSGQLALPAPPGFA